MSLSMESTLPRSETTLRVSVIDPEKDTRVMPFLESHTDALIYHHPFWLRALEEESQQQNILLACGSSDGSLCGLMPLAYTRGLPFDISNHCMRRRLASLPRTPFAGPIATNSAATKLMLSAAIQRAKAENLHLQIKTNIPLGDGELEELACTEWRPTYVLALPESPDQLTFGNAKNRHNLKWGVNKARKLGLSVRSTREESDLRAWYPLYLTTMRRNFAPARSFAIFLSLWRQLKDSGHFRLLLAEQITRSRTTLVAGSIFLMSGKTVFYAFTGSLTRHLGTHANDLILWEAIHQASRDGYRSFDFGEVPEEHPELVRFKTKWGAVPKPLYRYHFPAREHDPIHAKAHWVWYPLSQAWQYAPLSLTASAGKWLYRFL